MSQHIEAWTKWLLFCRGYFQTCFLKRKSLQGSLRFLWRFFPNVSSDNTSALVRVMTWCQTGNTPLPEPVMTCFTKAYMCHQASMNFNTLRPRQDGRHFPDDIFKCFFLNENAWILIKISLKFVDKGSIDSIPALVQIMAWRRPGDKPLSEPIMVSLLMHICVTRPPWVNTDMSSLAPGRCSRNFRNAIFKLILRIGIRNVSWAIAPIWMPQDLIVD